MIEEFKQKIWYASALVHDRTKDEMRKFLENFKQLEINLFLCDVLFLVPMYAKYLKEMLLGKKKIDKTPTSHCVKNVRRFRSKGEATIEIE